MQYGQSRFEEDYKSGQIEGVDIVPLLLVAAPEINTCHQSGGAATPGINKSTSEQMHSGEEPKISRQ